jgi:hypothetical protein
MSVPAAFFIDTSIYDSQQFNFRSVAFTTFQVEAKRRGLRLLIPDPTEREVSRHMNERVQKVMAFHGEAAKVAPFLADWSKAASKLTDRDGADARRHARRALRQFQKAFEPVLLGYDGIRLRTIMDWYDAQLPPFSSRKPKEFPDAFVISMLVAYAEKTNVAVAVVSGDGDFEQACDRFPRLLYFKTLPQLTELLLVTDSELSDVLIAVNTDFKALAEAVWSELVGLYVEHEVHDMDVLSSSPTSLDVGEVRLVGVGSNGICTVTFSLEVEMEHRLRWNERDPDTEELVERVDDFLETHPVSGSAKVVVDKDARKITAVRMLQLDQFSVIVTEDPRSPFGDM